VSVSANDNIKGQAESYIKRELRSLQDVTLVDKGADREQDIIAMEVFTKNVYNSGVIIYAFIRFTIESFKDCCKINIKK